MPQFATHDEFAARLGLTLTTDEQTRADTLLTLASGLIVDATGQKIELVTDDVLTARSVYGDRFRLPQRPVQSVSLVRLTPLGGDPVEVDPPAYYVDGGDLVRTRMPYSTELYFGMYGLGWLGERWEIEVTYTHGYDDADIPSIVKTVCMEAVRRIWVNPGGVVAESIAGEQQTYAPYSEPPRGLLLTSVEVANLHDALLTYQAGTITLR